MNGMMMQRDQPPPSSAYQHAQLQTRFAPRQPVTSYQQSIQHPQFSTQAQQYSMQYRPHYSQQHPVQYPHKQNTKAMQYSVQANSQQLQRYVAENALSQHRSTQSVASSASTDELEARFQHVSEQAKADVKQVSMDWVKDKDFTSAQLVEFDHLMELISSTHIDYSELSKMKEIGSGSFGKVYVSKYKKRKAAVKQIDTESRQVSFLGKMRELLLELLVLVRLEHPQIVHFHGTATDFLKVGTLVQPTFGLVFEYCEKGNLHDAMFEKRKNLKVVHKLQIACDVASALTYLHGKRIVHRDLNTKNILLMEDLRAKLADFGCARIIPAGAQFLPVTTFSGSAAYMSPEAIQGQALTQYTDIWSLSMCLWEIMMERKPWDGQYQDFASLQKALNNKEKLEVPEAYDPWPTAYLNAINSGMHYFVGNRGTAQEMLQNLEWSLYEYKKGKGRK